MLATLRPGRPSPRIEDTTPSCSPHGSRSGQVLSETGALSPSHFPETIDGARVHWAQRESHGRPYGHRAPRAASLGGIKPENNCCGADRLRVPGPVTLRLFLGLLCLAAEAIISLTHCLAKVAETGSENCPDRGATPRWQWAPVPTGSVIDSSEIRQAALKGDGRGVMTTAFGGLRPSGLAAVPGQGSA
jgi:hypothetical protein